MIAALGILKAAAGLLNWDRVLGALIGFGLSWCVLATLSQAIWLPNAREDERQKLAAEALVKTIETLKAREKTNVEISASDAVALCVHFGLQDDDRTECLRRVAAASADPGDGRAHHDDGPAVR